MGSLIELDGFAQPRLLARGGGTEPAPKSLGAYLRQGIDLADAYLTEPAPYDGVMRPMPGFAANASVPDGRTLIQQFDGSDSRIYLVPDQTDVIALSDLRTGVGDEFLPGAVAHYWASLEPHLGAYSDRVLQIADLDAAFPTWTTFELEPTQAKHVPVFSRDTLPLSFEGHFSVTVLRSLALRALAPFGVTSPEALRAVETDILAQELTRDDGEPTTWVSEFPAGGELVMRKMQLTRNDIVQAVQEATPVLEADLTAREVHGGVIRVAFTRWAPWMLQRLRPNARVLEPNRRGFLVVRKRLKEAGIPLYYRYLPKLAFEVLAGARERFPIVVTGNNVKAEEGRPYRFVGRIESAEEFLVKSVETTIPLLVDDERYRKAEGGPITVATLVLPRELSPPLKVKVIFHVQLGRPPRLEFRSVEGDILIPSHLEQDVAGAFTPKEYVAYWPAEFFWQARRTLSQRACERLAGNPVILDQLERALQNITSDDISPQSVQAAANALRRTGKKSVSDYFFGYGLHSDHPSPYEAELQSRLARIPSLQVLVSRVLRGTGHDAWQVPALNLTQRLYGAVAWLNLEVELETLIAPPREIKAQRSLYYHLFGRCNQDPVQARKLANLILEQKHREDLEDQVWALSRNLLWHVDFSDFAEHVDVAGLIGKLVNFGIEQASGTVLKNQQAAFLAIISLLTCAEFDRKLARKDSPEENAIRRLLAAYETRPVIMKAFSQIKQDMTMNQALQDILDGITFESRHLQRALLEIG